ncbi:GGDEF domain-containing protein [Gilvimarinus sp. SDUM040013]|uniref:diguanylate cyclase n=1 Tax=Gilvimarinus gilvus TaxID=3058038 RepID=A0ABU4RXA4_9GAMM|nr:GGDEF domain-containing protein [Gilvimarinus sp. SDUM040013]MDO3387703.1 GGDEF domain-containing protein [Gilvimarinus sp. SDUM040013]MDX6848856.1 GGDEF domain-containing protein [Gilvimarinus sp. SDUM040013]
MAVADNQKQWVLLCALLLTILLIALRDYLPKRQLQLVAGADQITYLYYDKTEGGGTLGEWIDQENLSFRCIRFNMELPSTYCGVSLELTLDPGDFTRGIDFSHYDTLLLDIDINSDQSRISLIFRNFNPDYSDASDFNSTQHISLPLRVRDLDQPIAISFDEFSVSEWWLVNRDIEREYTQPDFSNVVLMGIDARDRLNGGVHEFTINQVTLSGDMVKAETWYLAILLTWIIGMVLYLLYNAVYWRKQARGSEKKFRHLASRHRELRGEAASLKSLSERDTLSGLPNRRALTSAFEKLDMAAVQPMAFILIDIDHFKRINDRRGHSEGDRVIREVSNILLNNTRGDDLLARWGGEEYLLVCPATNSAQSLMIAEKIRHRVFSSEFFVEQPMAVSVSLGVAQMRDGESFESVFDRADTCLYKAKALGRNCSILDDEL